MSFMGSRSLTCYKNAILYKKSVGIFVPGVKNMKLIFAADGRNVKLTSRLKEDININNIERASQYIAGLVLLLKPRWDNHTYNTYAVRHRPSMMFWNHKSSDMFFLYKNIV
ncbi:hypothetical protein CBL_11450 [Carabus blaptoides fortunei]